MTTNPESPDCITVLKVDGMMCQKACGGTVEMALRKLGGVQFASASYVTKSAYCIWNDKSIVSAQNAIKAIAEVGFDSQIVLCVVLNINGMMCQKSCGSTIEAALSSVAEVIYVVVSFSKQKAFVWGSATHDSLVAIVESVGFEATFEAVSSVENMVLTATVDADIVMSVKGTIENILFCNKILNLNFVQGCLIALSAQHESKKI